MVPSLSTKGAYSLSYVNSSCRKWLPHQLILMYVETSSKFPQSKPHKVVRTNCCSLWWHLFSSVTVAVTRNVPSTELTEDVVKALCTAPAWHTEGTAQHTTLCHLILQYNVESRVKASDSKVIRSVEFLDSTWKTVNNLLTDFPSWRDFPSGFAPLRLDWPVGCH